MLESTTAGFSLLASPHPHRLPCEGHVHRVPTDLLELHRLDELHGAWAGTHLFRVEDLLNAFVLRLEKLERSTWLLHDLLDCSTLIVRLFIVCHFASACSRQLIRQRLRIREPPSWPFVLMSIRTLIADESHVGHHSLNFILEHVRMQLVTEHVRKQNCDLPRCGCRHDARRQKHGAEHVCQKLCKTAKKSSRQYVLPCWSN